MDSNQLLRNQRVVVQGDRIVAVGPSAELALPQGATVIDGAGRYLLPGLAEMHGHVPQDVGIEQAILLGSRTIDHLDGYMAALGGFDKALTAADMAPLVALTKANNVAVVPTQALWQTIIGASDTRQLQSYDELKYMPARVLAGWQRYLQQPGGAYYSGDTAALHAQNRQRLLRALNDADVTILMGTDAPQLYSVPGLSLRRELPKMAAAGISNYDILRSGTVLVGEYFADKDRFGQVKAGQRADLLLLEGNPLDDLSVLYQPAGVMVRGQWLSRATLDGKLADIAAARLAENQQ